MTTEYADLLLPVGAMLIALSLTALGFGALRLAFYLPHRVRLNWHVIERRVRVVSRARGNA